MASNLGCTFSGLAHCRHLKTVRTHLSGLVHHRIFPVDNPCDASKGLTAEVWSQMIQAGTVSLSCIVGKSGTVR